KDDLTGRFQSVVNRNPILACGFHTDIGAIVFGKPGRTTAQIAGKGREPFLFIGSYTFVVCSCDTCDNEVFVDIHPTTGWINNFKHSTSPQSSILRKQAGTGHSLKD